MSEEKRFSMVHATFEDWLDSHIEQMSIEEIQNDFENESSGCAGASVLLRTDRFRWLTAFYHSTIRLRAEAKTKDEALSYFAESDFNGHEIPRNTDQKGFTIALEALGIKIPAKNKIPHPWTQQNRKQ